MRAAAKLPRGVPPSQHSGRERDHQSAYDADHHKGADAEGHGDQDCGPELLRLLDVRTHVSSDDDREAEDEHDEDGHDAELTAGENKGAGFHANGPDDNEDTHDDEPSLGDIGRWENGKMEYGFELDQSDDEPSLGSTLSFNQDVALAEPQLPAGQGWVIVIDGEDDGDGLEPGDEDGGLLIPGGGSVEGEARL